MLIELPVVWIVIIDVVLWFVIHMSVAYLITVLPEKLINTNSWIYKQRKLEKGGIIYEKLFKIKIWKSRLPDGAALFKKGFAKKKILSKKEEYLKRFILETCRGELVHWIVILFSPLFFIWNWWWVGIIMIFYAIIANLPCILVQRYNRIRISRMLL